MLWNYRRKVAKLYRTLSFGMSVCWIVPILFFLFCRMIEVQGILNEMLLEKIIDFFVYRNNIRGGG